MFLFICSLCAIEVCCFCHIRPRHSVPISSSGRSHSRCRQVCIHELSVTIRNDSNNNTVIAQNKRQTKSNKLITHLRFATIWAQIVNIDDVMCSFTFVPWGVYVQRSFHIDIANTLQRLARVRTAAFHSRLNSNRAFVRQLLCRLLLRERAA